MNNVEFVLKTQAW